MTPIHITFTLERMLHVDRAGVERKVLIRIGGVEQVGPHEFACQYSCPGIQLTSGQIRGDDAVHAVQLCLRYIGSLIRGLEADGTARIWWLTPGDSGGF